MVAATNGGDGAAARGKDDAVLARPADQRARQGRPGPDVHPEPALSEDGDGELRRPAQSHLEGPGDDDLPRYRDEPEGQAERELRTRADRALHHRNRPLQRGRWSP